MNPRLVALSLALACAPSLSYATPPDRGPLPAAPWDEPLGHKHLAPEHRLLPRDALGGLGPADLARRPAHLLDTTSRPIVAREVLGYLPYWSYTASEPYVPLRWDLITTLAWFAVGMDGQGDIADRNGWGGATTAKIVQDAHARGVKVIVTVTNFTGSEIASIVNVAANRARAIDNCLALMAEHGADGINIDFEFVPKAARDGFVTFMAELKDAVRAAAPNGHEGHVSLAGPAIDWSGAYDYDVLLASTDGIMVMAYGYHWTKSDPGPTAPLYSGDLWRSRSISWTVDDYLTYGGEENRHKVIIGLPWYGRSWQVANTSVPGEALSDGSSKTFRAAEPEALSLGKQWEGVSRSTYYHKSSGGQLSQIWYDDGRSFREKVAYVDDMDLGGVGIWALGYEGAYPDLWDAIAAELVPPVVPVEPGPEAVEVVEPVEPGPEPVEPGPEPVEVVEVVEPDEVAAPPDEDRQEDLDRPGSPSARPLSPSRSLSARTVEEDGCAGGGASALGVSVLLVIALRRRRA